MTGKRCIRVYLARYNKNSTIRPYWIVTVFLVTLEV